MSEVIHLNSHRDLSMFPLWSRLAVITADVSEQVYDEGNEVDGWLLIKVSMVLNQIEQMLGDTDASVWQRLHAAIAERL